MRLQKAIPTPKQVAITFWQLAREGSFCDVCDVLPRLVSIVAADEEIEPH